MTSGNLQMSKVYVIGVLVGILLGGAAVSRARQPPPPRPPAPEARVRQRISRRNCRIRSRIW